MSAIASFIQLPVNALGGLKSAAVPKKTFFGSTKDKYDQYLQQNGRSIAEYPWSGYVLATLLTYLHKRGIDLMQSEHDELATWLNFCSGQVHYVMAIIMTLLVRPSIHCSMNMRGARSPAIQIL